jgi:hypothetical protein
VTDLRQCFLSFGVESFFQFSIPRYTKLQFCLSFLRCEARSFPWAEEHSLRVFEKRVLRKIFGPKRDEVTEDWRRLHNEELYALYSSPNTIRVIRSGRMRCAGHVESMGDTKGVYRVLVGRPEARRPLGRSKLRWGIILKCTFKKSDKETWTGLMWFSVGSGGGLL